MRIEGKRFQSHSPTSKKDKRTLEKQRLNKTIIDINVVVKQEGEFCKSER